MTADISGAVFDLYALAILAGCALAISLASLVIRRRRRRAWWRS